MGQSVCLSYKTAEPVKMPFLLWTQVGPRNHVLGGDQRPESRCRRGILGGEWRTRTADMIDVQFRMNTWVGRTNHVLEWGCVPSWTGAIFQKVFMLQ